MKLASIIATSCCLAALTSVAQAQDMFTFETQPTNYPANQPFADYPANPMDPPTYSAKTLTADNNALRTATFGVSGGTNDSERLAAFQFQNTAGAGTDLNGVYLSKVDQDSTEALTITFADPITSISLDFAVNNFTANNVPDGTLSLNTATAQGTYNATSTNFEGVLTYNPGSSFTTATISFTPGASGDNGWEIDNITVTPAGTAVPEPGSIALSAAGLVTMVGLLRRRKK